ncbi:MAG TPA: GrdX family protein [Sedimentibacter sp.]|nr:GrdX family protein [Sedimentibacter sp.]HNZ82467.1 GrdX family protein [Sedimentibacter sp.]HOH69558.1 GrdX family protein [Sedimentibacter sp.]HPW99882.1 GrdX family protein [Sedimentibacter sp.]HQB63184.1 GrdX family protein [Sedimentibacter sp.]
MGKTIVTNNSKVYNKYKDLYELVYLEDGNYTDVLYNTRDFIHKGFKLLTHPMAGSLKPNQTPYKSVIVEMCGKTDYESVELIENSIDAALKFLSIKKTPDWNEKILNDFKTVDLSIIENVVKNPMFNMHK